MVGCALRKSSLYCAYLEENCISLCGRFELVRLTAGRALYWGQCTGDWLRSGWEHPAEFKTGEHIWKLELKSGDEQEAAEEEAAAVLAVAPAAAGGAAERPPSSMHSSLSSSHSMNCDLAIPRGRRP